MPSGNTVQPMCVQIAVNATMVPAVGCEIRIGCPSSVAEIALPTGMSATLANDAAANDVSPPAPGPEPPPAEPTVAAPEVSAAFELAEQPASAVGWNGVGLVLMELRRYEDARNAFARAVDADAGLAAARYNLSFVLSQLGDFDGALRETRQALELEPLYVPQKFSLTIDLQY